MSLKQNLFLSVFVHECLMMLNDVVYTTFEMFVTHMSNYFFVSFQLMLCRNLLTSDILGNMRLIALKMTSHLTSDNFQILKIDIFSKLCKI